MYRRAYLHIHLVQTYKALFNLNWVQQNTWTEISEQSGNIWASGTLDMDILYPLNGFYLSLISSLSSFCLFLFLICVFKATFFTFMHQECFDL